MVLSGNHSSNEKISQFFFSLDNYFPKAGYIQSTVVCEEYEQMNKAGVMWIS